MQEARSLEMISQSHHTGIETQQRSPPFAPNRLSQSHHTGIETCFSQSSRCKRHAPNRTILELKLILSVRLIGVKMTPNRTILELKHQSPGSISNYRSNLPIAPYWNWNTIAVVLLQMIFFSPNRTILELKPVNILFSSSVNFSQSHHTGIETSWIVLILHPNDISQSHHTGIETESIPEIEANGGYLPIAPYWNWNGIS